MTLGDVAGTIDANEIERYAARVGSLQGRKPVPGLLETRAEEIAQAFDVVAGRPSPREEALIGHHQGAGEIIRKADTGDGGRAVRAKRGAGDDLLDFLFLFEHADL